MRMTLRHAAWPATLAVLVLALSAESCNSTTVSTSSGGTITVTSRSSSVNVPAGTAQSATANCQAGEVMLSGGYAITTPAYRDVLDPSGPLKPLNRYVVYEDYPDSTTSWTASVLNRASGDEAGDILLTADVVCASGLSETPTIAPIIGKGEVASMQQSDSAYCTGETAVTGGGYRITPPPHGNYDYAIVDSAGAIGGTNNWDVHGVTTDPGANIQAFTVCHSLPKGQVTTTVDDITTAPQVTAPPSTSNNQPTSGIGSAGCGPGRLLTGAGFSLTKFVDSLPVTSFYPDYRSTPPQWWLTLYSLPQPSGPNAGGSVSLIAICLVGV